MEQDHQREYISALEAVLFVAAGPVTSSQLSTALGVTKAEAIDLCKLLSAEYLGRRAGIMVQFVDDSVQLTTAPDTAPVIEAFLNIETTQKLSRAGVETLTIIAYRQPISRPGIDAVRGVNSDGVVRSLLSRGLIEEVGRADTPGRPILYSTTQEFLLYFGLASLDDLPPYEITDEDEEEKNLKILKE